MRAQKKKKSKREDTISINFHWNEKFEVKNKTFHKRKKGEPGFQSAPAYEAFETFVGGVGGVWERELPRRLFEWGLEEGLVRVSED